MPDSPQPEKQAGLFELGLVMAGAVSAGAYTAGVLDFLLEALEAWEQAKREGHDVLRHSVRIPVLAGASAGGMTAAALTAALSGRIEPVKNLNLDGDAPQGNALYECWVERVDIEQFLGLDDLAAQRVDSLLDCTALDALAEERMRPAPGTAAPRPYIADDLHVVLSLANLRGTPYKIPFKGQGDYGYPMTLHKDYAHFVYQKHPSQDIPSPIGGMPVALDPTDPGSEDWTFFKTAALATGAFPLALAPRMLTRYVDDYALRKWLVPQLVSYDSANRILEIKAREQLVDLDRDALARTDAVRRATLNVDGGTFDNEPLELGRRILAGDDMVNPRDPERAHRAVLLIDPFPQPAGDAAFPTTAPDVLAMALKIIGAMKANARFKEDELALAQDRDCYSRFIIGPVREGKAKPWHADIACGALGGFSGFFSRRFRRHDFQLGRRNCQRFLSHHFLIPFEAATKNPVFKADASNLARFAVRRPDGGTTRLFIPIIPLMPGLDPDKGNEVKALSFDEAVLTGNGLDPLRPLLKGRIKAVAKIYLKKYVDDPGLRNLITLFLKGKLKKLADWLIGMAKQDFTQNGVMR
ncbi:hypothetical protein [Solidesulfovibrio sp.]|uniref:hypothetical protein n=1 Tax=Solidesulfovibrio sp. TaxID=2910990 RepID=UPI002B1F7C84|nr:hypothetical protein [Solidesulfovibrio sp.]MEA5088957.1 hypothetical protein [Solidesulfovibrio sp.]